MGEIIVKRISDLDDHYIYAECKFCGHSHDIQLVDLPQDLKLSEMHRRLTCTACNRRDADIRIVYTGLFRDGGQYGQGYDQGND